LFTTLATEQLSAVVGVPNDTPVAVQPKSVVMFTGAGQVIVGTTLSVTVTTWVQVAELPLPSVTVQVTVVAPNVYVADIWSFTTLATEQLSTVVGVPNETPVAVQAVFVVTFTGAGQVIVGRTLSVTVTTWVQVAELLLPSVTVQVTVVAPNVYVADIWSFTTLATEQLSPVVGVPNMTPVAVQAVFVFTFTGAGQVIVGTTLSVTVTTWVHEAELLLPSVTVQVTVVMPNP
jgi:hypothetical protein